MTDAEKQVREAWERAWLCSDGNAGFGWFLGAGSHTCIFAGWFNSIAEATAEALRRTAERQEEVRCLEREIELQSSFLYESNTSEESLLIRSTIQRLQSLLTEAKKGLR